MDANRGATGDFEKFHLWGKRGGRGLPTIKAEKFAFTRWVARDAFQLALRGVEWGPNAEYKLGRGYFTLRDHRPGKQHLSHPTIRRLLEGESVVRQEAAPQLQDPVVTVETKDGGGWEPAGRHQLVLRKQDLSQQNQQVLNVDEQDDLVRAAEAYHVNYDAGRARYVDLTSGVVHAHHGGKVEHVRAGDDAQVLWKGKTEYATIERIIAVIDGANCSIWLFVLWYTKNGVGGRGGAGVQKDRIRDTTIVKRQIVGDDWVFMPVPVKMLVERVHVLHHCADMITDEDDRKMVWDATEVKDNRKHKGKCAVRRVCKRHGVHTCADPACVEQFLLWSRVMCHATPAIPRNLEQVHPSTYEIFTKRHGYHPRRPRIGDDAIDADDDEDDEDDDAY
jgi:hypothetical protein